MTPIAEVLARVNSMTIPELEAEFHSRDEEVARIRAEMKTLHPFWEAKHLQKQRETSNPNVPSQTVGAKFS